MSFIGHNLTCMRGDTTIFTALSFVLSEGGAIAVRGSNGSGKSSLLRLAAGLIPPLAGELKRDGVTITNDVQCHINGLHYLGHLDGAKSSYTVEENLNFWINLFATKKTKKKSSLIPQALERLGISKHSDVPAEFLSAGQRQRLALARLVTIPRPLWILDEPESSLDDEGHNVVAEMIGEHRANGGMVMIAFHGKLNLSDLDLLQMDSFTSRTVE